MWPGARAGHGEANPDHHIAVEGPNDLAADLVGDHEHTQRNKFRVGEVPDFFLQRHAGAEVFNSVAAPKDDRIGGHAGEPCSKQISHRPSPAATTLRVLLSILIRGSIFLVKPPLHPLKASLEFSVRFAQRGLSIER